MTLVAGKCKTERELIGLAFAEMQSLIQNRRDSSSSEQDFRAFADQLFKCCQKLGGRGGGRNGTKGDLSKFIESRDVVNEFIHAGLFTIDDVVESQAKLALSPEAMFYAVYLWKYKTKPNYPSTLTLVSQWDDSNDVMTRIIDDLRQAVHSQHKAFLPTIGFFAIQKITEHNLPAGRGALAYVSTGQIHDVGKIVLELENQKGNL